MSRRAAVVPVLLALGLALAAPARARAAVSIDLYTMGQGDDAFSKFGHAALCVESAGLGGRCYNFGTADFTRPVPLALGFLAGRAPFWVSVIGRDRMLELYREMDRSVWRQRLPLTPAVALGIASKLQAIGGRDAFSYHYRFFHDNCATRLRDMIDDATGGTLRRGATGVFSEDYRAQVRTAFAGDVPLAVAGELFLARLADAPQTVWDAMYLPDVLRAEVARQLGAPATLVFARVQPLAHGSPARGRFAVISLGLVIAGLAGALATRRRRAGLTLAAFPLGLFGLATWGVVIVSTVPELRWNEVALVLLPLDLALPFLRRWLRGYLIARAVGLAVVAGLALAGVLAQPLGAPLCAVGAIVGALLVATRPPTPA